MGKEGDGKEEGGRGQGEGEEGRERRSARWVEGRSRHTVGEGERRDGRCRQEANSVFSCLQGGKITLSECYCLPACVMLPKGWSSESQGGGAGGGAGGVCTCR